MRPKASLVGLFASWLQRPAPTVELIASCVRLFAASMRLFASRVRLWSLGDEAPSRVSDAFDGNDAAHGLGDAAESLLPQAFCLNGRARSLTAGHSGLSGQAGREESAL